MSAEYGIRSSSSSTSLSSPLSIKEKEFCANLTPRRCCRKSYYVCLGTLAHMVHTQIQRNYTKSTRLYSTGSKYAQDLYMCVRQCKYKELLVDDFYRSFIASVALFALGAKLVNELTEWKVS
ncbi:uncharacterized protein LOC143210993 [Lasioglossum baleicum]|uniref:uncharacterized protein LOC143210993 n=1 Tax=Lasioglossum baleicum TaxID=434251 RepID=UPI003FCDC65B